MYTKYTKKFQTQFVNIYPRTEYKSDKTLYTAIFWFPLFSEKLIELFVQEGKLRSKFLFTVYVFARVL